MNAKLMSLALVAASLVGVAAPVLAQERPQATHRAAKTTAPDPAQQVYEAARLFRSGDLAGLVQVLVPPTQLEQIRLAYELHRLEPTSEEKRAEFAEKLARFTAPDAVDELMAEIEPKLENARPQAPGALLMGFGAMQMAVNSPDSELTDEQRAALQSVLPGFQRWASTTDFLSSASMREALTLLTDAARRAGISDIDQLKAMSLDDVLDRAGTVFAAAKEAVRIYGLDIDAVVDSMQVEVLAVDGTTARVRTTVTVFDAPVWTEHDLVLVEGRWYDKASVSKWSMHHTVHVDG